MSEQHDTGGPAYPGPCQTECVVDINEGMTLLDWFAGKVASGHETVKDNRTWNKGTGTTFEEWQDGIIRGDVEYCYKKAAAMIAEKRRREGGGAT